MSQSPNPLKLRELGCQLQASNSFGLLMIINILDNIVIGFTGKLFTSCSQGLSLESTGTNAFWSKHGHGNDEEEPFNWSYHMYVFRFKNCWSVSTDYNIYETHEKLNF